METSSTSPTPDEAAAALGLAQSAGSGLARGLSLPSNFYRSIGAAVAVQIGTATVGIVAQNAWGLSLVVVGLIISFAVAVIQIKRFRALNGVRVRGFESRVVGGTATMSSTAYGLGFGGALWAGIVGTWWLVPAFSVLGGIGYAAAGKCWWQAYQRDPAANSRGDSTLWLIVLFCVAGALAIVLALNS